MIDMEEWFDMKSIFIEGMSISEIVRGLTIDLRCFFHFYCCSVPNLTLNIDSFFDIQEDISKYQ